MRLRYALVFLFLLLPSLAWAQATPSTGSPRMAYNFSYTSSGGVTFANLGTACGGGSKTPVPPNCAPQIPGTLVFCKDCTNTTSCAGGGSGAMAIMQNGAWGCNVNGVNQASVSGVLTNLTAGPGAISITGNSGNGSDQISGIAKLNGTTLFAQNFSGATLDAKLAAAETACPTGGCTIDASAITGAQTWSNTLTISKPTKLLLNGQIVFNGAPLTNGLINITQGGSGSDISCAPGVGVFATGPGNPPSPSNILSLWQCFIKTTPTTFLQQATISSITATSNTGTVTTSASNGLAAGESIRIAGTSQSSFNGWVVVQSISSPTIFTYHRPFGAASATGGTATQYMPVIQIALSVSNVKIHDINFVADANTGSVISEAGYASTGLSIDNNHFVHNQFINDDGVGASGFGIELSSTSGLGGNYNQQEVAFNAVAGLSGCIEVAQAQAVIVQVVGNFCYGGVSGPQVQLDTYAQEENQNIEYRLNSIFSTTIPTSGAALEIDSGFGYNIDDNDFEINNQGANTGVSDILINQASDVTIRGNSFLAMSVGTKEAFAINIASTAVYTMMRIISNHTTAFGTAFFNDPYCAGCNTQGALLYDQYEGTINSGSLSGFGRFAFQTGGGGPANAGFITSSDITGFTNPYNAAGIAIPACAAALSHKRACVSDSTACTSGSTYTSGGATACEVWCNATNWIESGSGC